MHRLELLQCHSHQSHILQVVCSYYGRLAHAHHMLHIPWPAPDVYRRRNRQSRVGHGDIMTSQQPCFQCVCKCERNRDTKVDRIEVILFIWCIHRIIYRDVCYIE